MIKWIKQITNGMTENIEHGELHWTDNVGINFFDNIRQND